MLNDIEGSGHAEPKSGLFFVVFILFEDVLVIICSKVPCFALNLPQN